MRKEDDIGVRFDGSGPRSPWLLSLTGAAINQKRWSVNLQIMTCDVKARGFNRRVCSILLISWERRRIIGKPLRGDMVRGVDRGKIQRPRIIAYVDI